MRVTYRKSLRDIRTMSGKVDRIANPYTAYMQITALEMEKARRLSEKRSCEARIATIDRRLCMIEAEKQDLLRRLVAQKSLTIPGPPANGKTEDVPVDGARSSRIRR